MTLSNLILLSWIIFFIGLYGSLTKKSAVLVVISLELMFNAVALNFVAFSRFAPGGLIGATDVSNVLSGQVMAIFIIAIGAAEAALALSIVIAMYREKNTIEFSETIEIREKDVD
ncbi:MAG: NADH-quinone oxidoreductase subunit NuoK [Chloroflexota bacterium]|jgi:NADH-quinone oxidoreductase subunit K|nr:NADH-quinone oxidoreductase subunit NuoK [Chloroflexota bacterium]MEC7156971.1 NADH-quinone oxidoreductase subunit NuoK [Chloroflexota bacterium]MEC7270980.1 NADH-quinone oxidoreductase subunit NuoK [Chloroflexota bacterium]MEC8440547.1 NADH-quinone oxidoreductase subunit NuoK [Chloroflexota bacterium]MEC8712892.1 NADH-quinone oxidoreductase subunit NuoK [Chloroflexota bacterium]|tara:strand:- start:1221 stop:1565 length:345 start_codon:yes stop_codon:yes gene_type:complete